MKIGVRSLIGISMVVVVGLVSARAQELRPSPPKPEPATPPVGTRSFNESDVFFGAYAKAAQAIQRRKEQAALGYMDEATKRLATSPWLEIALLKRAELNENFNLASAMDDYDALRLRVERSQYFQSSAEQARVLQQALEGAIARGITRVRISRIRGALETYFALNLSYPESLAKLSILGYVGTDDIRDAHGKPIAYFTRQQHFPQFVPQANYSEFQLQTAEREPFYVKSPKLDGTSLATEGPHRYVGLLRVTNRTDPVRIQENQTLEGYIVAIIGARGAIVCTDKRVLVLTVPE